MLLEHLTSLPRIHSRAISQYGGMFEYRAYLRAFIRLPLAVRRRLSNLRSYVVSDRDILGSIQ
jgi:hypothetical protein